MEIMNQKLIEKLNDVVFEMMKKNDPAHDFEHTLRVCNNVKFLCKHENIDPFLPLIAAILHDVIVLKKSTSNSKNSSVKSSLFAKKLLKNFDLSEYDISLVSDAISTHSFSKHQTPKTIIGKILQDADRLDALGAIGIARAFTVGGIEKRNLYNSTDPFCRKRLPDDNKFTLDHFFKKLLILSKLMHTKTAKNEASRRTKVLKNFIRDLKLEI